MLEATRYTRIYGQQQLGKCVYHGANQRQRINTLHAEIIYTSPFINAEIKIICLRSKWQALLIKP